MLEGHEVGVGSKKFSQIVCDQVLVRLQTFNFYLLLDFFGMTHFLQIINIYTRVVLKDLVDLIIWSNYRIS